MFPCIVVLFSGRNFLFWLPLFQLPDSQAHTQKISNVKLPEQRTSQPCQQPQTPFALPSLLSAFTHQITLKNILMASAMVLDKSLDDVSSHSRSAPTMPNRFRRSFLRRGGILAVPVAQLVLPRSLSPARPPLRPPHGAQLMAQRLCQATSSPRKSSCPTCPRT